MLRVPPPHAACPCAACLCVLPSTACTPLGSLLAALPGFKKDMTSKRRQTVPESEYKEGPEGLK